MGVERMPCCGALTSVYADAGHRAHEPGCPVRHQHIPHRGSDVERWLKRRRDEFEGLGPWHALDALLDEYRLRADVGADLDVPAEQLGPNQEK